MNLMNPTTTFYLVQTFYARLHASIGGQGGEVGLDNDALMAPTLQWSF